MTEQPAPTAVADTRRIPLGRIPDGALARIVPKRATRPPQVARFDSAM